MFGSYATLLTRKVGIVNLFVGMKESDGLEGGKVLKTNEKWGDLCGYATCFPPVTSFQI
jgi:hypothetical protein